MMVVRTVDVDVSVAVSVAVLVSNTVEVLVRVDVVRSTVTVVVSDTVSTEVVLTADGVVVTLVVSVFDSVVVLVDVQTVPEVGMVRYVDGDDDDAEPPWDPPHFGFPAGLATATEASAKDNNMFDFILLDQKNVFLELRDESQSVDHLMSASKRRAWSFVYTCTSAHAESLLICNTPK